MTLLNSNDTKECSQLYQILVGTGLIDGGSEQLLMDVIPKVSQRSDVKHLSVRRNTDRLPVLQVYIETESHHIETIVEIFEDAMSTTLVDDNRLSLFPLVEIATGDEASDEIPPFGVRYNLVQEKMLNSVSSAWWEVEAIIIELVAYILKQEKQQSLDRKTFAPIILCGLILDSCEKSQLKARTFNLAKSIISAQSNSSKLLSQFRKNIHQLKESGIVFIPDSVRNTEHFSRVQYFVEKLLEEKSKINNVQEDCDIHQHIWLSISSKLGFTNIEASYIALMVGADETESNR